MEKTPAIEAMIAHKSQKFIRQLGQNIKVHWVCQVAAGEHISEIEITGFHGNPLFAKAKSNDLYKTFDEVERKISKQAARIHDSHIRPHAQELQYEQ
jgi:ribosome-associated translation inhibitor RaiA